MEKFKFIKMHGAGNDFVVFDLKTDKNLQLSPEIVKKICHRNFGIGADGVLVISDTETADFKVEYFEADGSIDNLCANGSRCIIKYAYDSGRLKHNKTRFIFNNNEYSGEILPDDLVKFNLNPPVSQKFNFKIKAADQLITASYIDNGTPHIIIKIQDVLKIPDQPGSFYTDIDELPLNELGKELRHSPDFAPNGTNVNFYSVEDNVVFIRSFERGVEGETLACGTGIAATAIVCSVNEKIEPPVRFLTRGGDQLSVNFYVANQMVKDLSLIGKVMVVFNGELLI
ncbi:diaminopimelate epimerase [Bacteroidota bacterium]